MWFWPNLGKLGFMFMNWEFRICEFVVIVGLELLLMMIWDTWDKLLMFEFLKWIWPCKCFWLCELLWPCRLSLRILKFFYHRYCCLMVWVERCYGSLMFDDDSSFYEFSSYVIFGGGRLFVLAVSNCVFGWIYVTLLDWFSLWLCLVVWVSVSPRLCLSHLSLRLICVC